MAGTGEIIRISSFLISLAFLFILLTPICHLQMRNMNERLRRDEEEARRREERLEAQLKEERQLREKMEKLKEKRRRRRK